MASDNSMNVPLIDASNFNNDAPDLFDWHKDEYSHITIYIDSEKRQSVAIANGIEYNTVQKILKEINSNRSDYTYQTYELIDSVSKSRFRYVVFIAFIIILFCMFIGKIAFYTCIGIELLIILCVLSVYTIKYCDRKIWIKNEIKRINNLVEESNKLEYIYSDKYKHKKEKGDWTDYLTVDNDENDVNNLFYINLRLKKLSKKEKDEDVIKLKIYIWLLNKKQDRKQGDNP
eukprot:127510_1